MRFYLPDRSDPSKKGNISSTWLCLFDAWKKSKPIQQQQQLHINKKIKENKPTTSTTFWYLSFHPQSPRSLRHLAPIGASQGICHFTCSSLSIDAVLRQATLRGARGVVRLMPCSAQAVHRDVAWRQKGPLTPMNGDPAIKFLHGVFGWLGILRVSTPSMPTDKALWEGIINHHDPWTGGWWHWPGGVPLYFRNKILGKVFGGEC